MGIRTMLRGLLCALAILRAGPAVVRAAEPTLTLYRDGGPLTLTATELLARPDAVPIIVPDDVAYGRTMQYRAVPVARWGRISTFP